MGLEETIVQLAVSLNLHSLRIELFPQTTVKQQIKLLDETAATINLFSVSMTHSMPIGYTKLFVHLP